MWTAIFTRNIGWKLLSLGTAVLLWISVASEPELATLHSVPVEYKGVPDDLEITSDFVENVFLEMRGPAGRLRDLRPKQCQPPSRNPAGARDPGAVAVSFRAAGCA